MLLPLPSSSSITHQPSMSSFPARFPEGTRLLPPNSADSWGPEKLQDQLHLTFTLWETLERQIARCHDPKDISKAILQMPNNQQFRLFQRTFPSCCIAKCLSLTLSPYYSIRDKEKACRQKEIYCPWRLLPSLPFPCPGAPGSGLAPALPFLVYTGLSHTPRLLGLQSHQPISLGCQRGRGWPGRVLTYKAQRKGQAGVPWDTSQDSSSTDTQSRASGSKCPGQTHRAFAAAPAPLLQVLRMNWCLPMVLLLWARLPSTCCPGCWLWLWACHVPGVLLQAGGCWAGWSVINCKSSSSPDLFSSARSPCCCFQALPFLLASSCSPSSIPGLLFESTKAAT